MVYGECEGGKEMFSTLTTKNLRFYLLTSTEYFLNNYNGQRKVGSVISEDCGGVSKYYDDKPSSKTKAMRLTMSSKT